MFRAAPSGLLEGTSAKELCLPNRATAEPTPSSGKGEGTEHDYDIQITGSSASTMNGAGETPHHTIAGAMCTMLSGANLPPKFWPYAFTHALRLYNLSVHDGQTQTPYEICTGKRTRRNENRVRIERQTRYDTQPHNLKLSSFCDLFVGFVFRGSLLSYLHLPS